MKLMSRLRIYLMKKLELRLCARGISATIKSLKKTRLIDRQQRRKQLCWLNKRPFCKQNSRQLKRPSRKKKRDWQKKRLKRRLQRRKQLSWLKERQLLKQRGRDSLRKKKNKKG